MGKKDEKVEAVLHLIRKQYPLTLKQEKFCNRECVERFLKGKGENVKKAAKQLISCLSWKQNIDIERLGAEEFSTELADGVAYVAGHDGESRPVIIFRFKHDYQKLCTQKQFTRLVAFTMETAISSMSRNAEQSFVLLFDASFFRSSSAFANLLLATLKIIADYYPCQLYKAFIIDPPSFFSYIWKGVRPFVELSTVTMIVSSVDYDEQLNISHVSSPYPRSASLRFDASSIKSTATIGSASSRFAFTVSQHRHDSLKPWYLSFTDTSPFNAAVDYSTASKVSPLSARSLSFASPAARGFRDAKPAVCRKGLFPSTSLPEKTKTVLYPKTPRPSFFQSPAIFFRGEKNVGRGGGGGEKSREAFVPYLKFYRRPYDETAYRSKLRGPRGFVSVVSSHRRCRHVSFSQRF
uniref:Random slug protein 5 n=1 Tax=Noccaea caerulescens TaxID=107243 RepID=A0A1J3JUE4_NOCCA